MRLSIKIQCACGVGNIGCVVGCVAKALGAGFLSSFLSDSMINEMSCVGSVLIIAIALNTMKVTKIKVANLLPSAFMPLLLCLFIH